MALAIICFISPNSIALTIGIFKGTGSVWPKISVTRGWH